MYTEDITSALTYHNVWLWTHWLIVKCMVKTFLNAYTSKANISRFQIEDYHARKHIKLLSLRGYMKYDGFKSEKQLVPSLLYSCSIERSKLECRRVITSVYDWLKKTRHFFIQSEVKPTPIRTRLHAFSNVRVSNMYLLQVLIGSLDCLCPF